MAYNILQKIESTSAEYWKFVVDTNNNVVSNDNLDIIENKLKELNMAVPNSYLKVVSELTFDNDYIFSGTNVPTQYTYEVNYYFDDVNDITKSITGEAVLNTVIVPANYSSATYELDTTKTTTFPSQIVIGVEGNVYNIYYKTIVIP